MILKNILFKGIITNDENSLKFADGSKNQKRQNLENFHS